MALVVSFASFVCPSSLGQVQMPGAGGGRELFFRPYSYRGLALVSVNPVN